MSFFGLSTPPPPEKTITSKFTNLHFNLFKLRVFTCMYVKLHNIACYYMYWIVFFFLKHKQSLFFKHLSNPAHLFLFSLVILCKKNESIGNGEPSPLLKKNPPKLIHGILGASWKGILQKISLTKFWNWDVHVCLNKIFRVTRFWSCMYK